MAGWPGYFWALVAMPTPFRTISFSYIEVKPADDGTGEEELPLFERTSVKVR